MRAGVPARIDGGRWLRQRASRSVRATYDGTLNRHTQRNFIAFGTTLLYHTRSRNEGLAFGRTLQSQVPQTDAERRCLSCPIRPFCPRRYPAFGAPGARRAPTTRAPGSRRGTVQPPFGPRPGLRRLSMPLCPADVSRWRDAGTDMPRNRYAAPYGTLGFAIHAVRCGGARHQPRHGRAEQTRRGTVAPPLRQRPGLHRLSMPLGPACGRP